MTDFTRKCLILLLLKSLICLQFITIEYWFSPLSLFQNWVLHSDKCSQFLLRDQNFPNWATFGPLLRNHSPLTSQLGTWTNFRRAIPARYPIYTLTQLTLECSLLLWILTEGRDLASDYPSTADHSKEASDCEEGPTFLKCSKLRLLTHILSLNCSTLCLI